MPTLPVVGKVPRGWLIAVGAGSLAAIGYVLYRRHQAAATSAASSATTTPPAGGAGGDPYPPDGTVGNPGDPNSTDPATGMTYGDEALSGGGFVGGFAGGFPGGTTGGGPVGTGTNPTGGPPFGNNADWANYAEQQLSGFIDPATLSAALGVYLTGRAATSDQTSLIDQAIAIAGYPPVAGPDNFPPNIKQGGSSGGGGKAANPVTGLKQIQTGFTGADIAWNPATGATSYQVTSTKGTVKMLTATSARIQDISSSRDRGDQATVTVLAEPAAAGAKPATLVIHTRR